MIRSTLAELEQLTRLHDLLTVRLELLAGRARLTPEDQQQRGHLEHRRLQVADRIAWLEQRDEPHANTPQYTEQPQRKRQA